MLTRIIQCAVLRFIDSSGCESHPATRRSRRHHLERFKEVTNWTEALQEKASVGKSASMQAVTRVNVEQASKRVMWEPTRLNYGEGRGLRTN